MKRFQQPTLLQFGTSGLAASTSLPVKVSKTLTISCSDPTLVTSQFRQLTLTCGYDGSFNLPDNLPDCRAALKCPAAPTPPTSTNLALVPAAGSIYEFQTQVQLSFH
jgi:hypothetical protein